MIEYKELQLDGIEGRRVKIEQLGSKDARHVARRIMNVMGSALKEAAAGEETARVEVIAMGAILERLDDSIMDDLTERFERKTLIEATPGAEDWMPIVKVHDLIFGSGPGLARWVKWLGACIEFSCADFFGELLAQARQARTRMSSSNGSQSTSPTPGFSTASPPAANTTMV